MDAAERQRQFVEECALYFEQVGLTRIAGRILGWLLICDPPMQQQGDLVQALEASKSSISVAIRDLLRLYLIERVTVPGDNGTYYRTARDMWSRSFRARMNQLTELQALSERGLEALSDAPPERRRRLEFMRDMNAYMAEAFPKLLDAWDVIKREKGYEDL